MTLPGTIAHWLFAFAAAGAVSFFFVGLPSYLERRERPLWVRGLHDAGLLLALAHLAGAFLLAPRSENFAAAGIVMYTLSIAVFLSAMEAASGVRMQRSFIDHPLPDRLITDGPYQWVRHPFGAGYLLGAFALPAAIDDWRTWLIAAPLVAITIAAAVREERVWLASAHAEEYRDYRRRTGMFLPFIGRG